MIYEEAAARAAMLNKTGKHKDSWLYYVACHDGGSMGQNSPNFGQWFVMRRPKSTIVLGAVFANGKTSALEQ